MLKVIQYYNKHKTILNGIMSGCITGFMLARGFGLENWEYWTVLLSVITFQCLLMWRCEKIEYKMEKLARARRLTFKSFSKRRGY
jgi:hypothetical protein